MESRVRFRDVQADGLAYMFAHEFVPQRYTEEELLSGIEHSLEYPTKAPITGHYIDLQEVVEGVLFAALADLHQRGNLRLELDEAERLWGLGALYRFLRQTFGYRKWVLYATRTGSLPRSPLYQGLEAVYDALMYPGSPFLERPRLPVAALLRRLLRWRRQQVRQERDPYLEVLLWVGDELIREGYYVEGTDVVVGATSFTLAHPDVPKMLELEPEALALKERLERFRRREPELAEALQRDIRFVLREQQELYRRRTSL